MKSRSRLVFKHSVTKISCISNFLVPMLSQENEAEVEKEIMLSELDFISSISILYSKSFNELFVTLKSTVYSFTNSGCGCGYLLDFQFSNKKSVV